MSFSVLFSSLSLSSTLQSKFNVPSTPSTPSTPLVLLLSITFLQRLSPYSSLLSIYHPSIHPSIRTYLPTLTLYTQIANSPHPIPSYPLHRRTLHRHHPKSTPPFPSLYPPPIPSHTIPCAPIPFHPHTTHIQHTGSNLHRSFSPLPLPLPLRLFLFSYPVLSLSTL